MTEAELRARLAAPFAADEIEWRVQESGKSNRGPWVKVVAYVNNRAIMDRLDQVCGVGHWRNEFVAVPGGEHGGMLCGISLWIGDAWITKYDGADLTNVAPVKGGVSDAMKRAAVQWGVGRYLYDLKVAFAVIAEPGDRDAYGYLKKNDAKHGDALRWNPPKLPAWALPAEARTAEPTRQTVAERDAAATKAEPAQATVTAKPAGSPRVYLHPLTNREIGWRDLLLPGTKAHLDGHGGKRLGDVPARDLPAIRAKLFGMPQYADRIDAIDEALAEQLGGGGE